MLNVVSLILVVLFLAAAVIQWRKKEKASAVIDVLFAALLLSLSIYDLAF